MKTLIVYYSLEGNTKYTAEILKKSLQCDILQLEAQKAYPTGKATKYIWGGKSAVMDEKPNLKPYQINLSDYDTIVLGTPVWAGTYAPPLHTFLEENNLQGKKVAIFVCSTSGRSDSCLQKLEALLPKSDIIGHLSLIDPSFHKNEKKEEQILSFAAKILSSC